MTPRINRFTFERPDQPPFEKLQVGQQVQVLVVDLRYPTEELLWLQVDQDLGSGVYRAETLECSRYFPELPQGDTVYLKAEQVRTAQGVTTPFLKIG